MAFRDKNNNLVKLYSQDSIICSPVIRKTAIRTKIFGNGFFTPLKYTNNPEIRIPAPNASHRPSFVMPRLSRCSVFRWQLCHRWLYAILSRGRSTGCIY